MPQNELYPEEEARLAEVEKGENERGAARAEELAAEVPMAEEGLSPTSISQVSQALAAVIEKLSDGQVPAPPIEVPETDITQAPAALYAGLKLVTMFGQQQGWPPEMLFDAGQAVTSIAGLDDATAKLQQIARSGPPAPKAAPKEAPAPKAPPGPGERVAAAMRKSPKAPPPGITPGKPPAPDKPGPGDKVAAMFRKRG
jgi:hypothetical protein